MNKTVAVAAIVGAVILSPVASMGITLVREALLGLAPEDQIVTLADKIDESRVANEQKIATLEQELATAKQTIDEQKTTIETQKLDQDAKIAEQASELTKQKAEQAAITAKVDKQAECDKLRSTYSFCTSGRYSSESALNEYLDFKKDAPKDEIKEIKDNFAKCQDMATKCN